ncbi:hypothetical protein D3C78_1310630 [compost metagenome]
MMKESISSITPVFNTRRMVSDYWHKIYVPTVARGNRFMANHFEVASKVASYKQFIRDNWSAVHVRKVDILENSCSRIELNKTTFIAEVELGAIRHKDVRVEAVGSDGRRGIWKVKLEPVNQVAKGLYIYEGVTSDIPINVWDANVNVRVTPISPDFANHFEMELAVWG